jgi:hypothetical protein
MTAWADLLNEAWNDLAETAPVSRAYRSRVIPGDLQLEISAGMRATDNAPCLMLQTALEPQAMFELSGMRLASIGDSNGPLLVLSLEDSTRRDLFTTICADVIGAASAAGSNDPLGQFLARLGAWRHFLRDRHDGLSRQETVGLIGELLVLEQLLGHTAGTLACWDGPNDGLHDFHLGGHSLEVKTGLGPSSVIYISRLDQLDTNGVDRLDLLHVRLIEAPDGRSLGAIIAAIAALLPGSTHVFDNLLLQRGLLPDDIDARNTPRVRTRSIDGYEVTDGFPRLMRSALPVAITDATYTLEVRALQAFSREMADVLDAFLQGGHIHE